MSLRFTAIASTLALGLAFATVPAVAAASYPKIPSCQSVGRSIGAAIGPIGRIEDRTAGVHKIEALSTGDALPYHVLRTCLVYVPGHNVPLVITFNAPMTRQFVTAMDQASKHMGLKSQRLDGGAYGDLAYLFPQVGGGNASVALVGSVGITLTTWADDHSVENMTKNLVDLIR